MASRYQGKTAPSVRLGPALRVLVPTAWVLEALSETHGSDDIPVVDARV